MIDSYLWANTQVLKNKLNIKDQKQLDEAEANYTVYRLKELALNPLKGDYDLKSILNNFLAHKKQENINSLTKEQLAYNNLQKFRRKGLTKCDYKKELSEALLKKYENID
jgi:hypothetical protein